MKTFKKNNKTFKRKNLSPAKKFKLRLRKAKMQQRLQSKEEYFEHDNRSNLVESRVQAVKPAKEKLNKKGRRAQMFVEAYLKQQRELYGNGGNESGGNGNGVMGNLAEEKLFSGDGNLLKSTIYKTETNRVSRESKEQEQTHQKMMRAMTSHQEEDGSEKMVKCCCHCACMGAKRAAFNEFPMVNYGESRKSDATFGSTAVARATASSSEITTKILNKTTTTTVESKTAADLINLNMCIDPHHHQQHQQQPIYHSNQHPTTTNSRHYQFYPISIASNCNSNNNNLQDNFDFVRTRGGGLREMRSVVRYFRNYYISFSCLSVFFECSMERGFLFHFIYFFCVNFIGFGK